MTAFVKDIAALIVITTFIASVGVCLGGDAHRHVTIAPGRNGDAPWT